MSQSPRWIAKAHLNYDYFSCSTVGESYQHELVDFLGFSFNYKYENQDIFYDLNDVDKHAQLLLSTPGEFDRQIDFIVDQIEQLHAAGARYGSEQNREAFDAWFVVFRKAVTTLGAVFGIEQALEERLRSFLLPVDFQQIAFAKETATAHEQRSILEIACLPENSPDVSERVDQHLRTFAWLGSKMLTYTPFTKTQVMERVIAARGAASEKLRQLDENRKQLEASSQEIYSRLNTEEQHLVQLYQKLLFLRTDRAEAFCEAAEQTLPLFTWVASQLGFSRAEIVRFSKKEIDEMLDTETRLDPNMREKYHMQFVDKTFVAEFGSWGTALERQDHVTEIRGTVACAGFARGVVKIINDTPDVQDFQPGQILVSSYTNPNMIMAMERAAAIVTNIGGLTSHAAIVSREMNKPCVIGTKIATQVLKNGDLVEVDATNGIVKKVS